MRQNRFFLFATLAALVAGSSVVACGDDDENGTTPPTPDSGTPDPDSGTTPPPVDEDAGPDAGEVPPAPLAKLAEVPLTGAVNPYGLTYASDGLLYISGGRVNPDTSEPELAVWRVKADNTLDTDFGTGGVMTLNIGTGAESSYGIVEVSSTKLVVQATLAGRIWLVSLDKTGTTFAFGTPKALVFGWEDADFASWPVGGASPSYTSWGIAADKSNAASPKIVVFAFGAPAKVSEGTQRVDNDRWIGRYLADADFTFDTGFNGGAPYTFDADGKNLPDGDRRGFVEPDGKIVSVGYTDFGTGLRNHVVLLRLTAAGVPDSTFGFGTTVAGQTGQTKFNPFLTVDDGMAEAYAVVRQASGRYVTTGYGVSSFNTATEENDLVTFGVKDDGLDPTYGRLGAFAIQSEGTTGAGVGARPYRENGRDIVLLPDQRTVHVGCWDDFASIFVVTKDGAADTTSGEGGRFTYTHPMPFFKAALSPDGKHVAATAQSTGGSSILAIVKVGE